MTRSGTVVSLSGTRRQAARVDDEVWPVHRFARERHVRIGEELQARELLGGVDEARRKECAELLMTWQGVREHHDDSVDEFVTILRLTQREIVEPS